MRIITFSCPSCGTIIAINELEDNRVMKCPGLKCEEVLKFQDIPKEDREYFLQNKDLYDI